MLPCPITNCFDMPITPTMPRSYESRPSRACSRRNRGNNMTVHGMYKKKRPAMKQKTGSQNDYDFTEFFGGQYFFG